MEKYFKIKEISTLFNIGIDSLRYYEKIGLIKPKRGKNNYRLYSVKDIYKLNIIADLRKLHFSLSEIKEYLEDLSLSNTYNLLNKQNKIVEEEIKQLEKQKALLEIQIENLDLYKKMTVEEFEIKELESRRIVKLETDVYLDEEVDFSIRFLQKQHGFKLHQFENYEIGASMLKEDIKDGIVGKYNTVFMLQENSKGNTGEFLPKGSYLSYVYKGSYKKLKNNLEKIFEFAKNKNLKLDNTIYELYYIDTRYTEIEEEYLTEIQVLIKE
ncbi:MerR family transcriptional regulator [Miniphocaeibacter halophilus]|uniref:MerR family transcriptional regulator n=1 Tax=Miniphocaeibacter halophilus TaxID=2931922 RepID=A0AC61MU70_9FIRM|nr:MerR family transcriptional regulator [Miniphocaeibacter halophilus]QQK06938.1 MerR family transcriptional regulator [Miniphocaeibacter halophilus]